VTQSANLTSFLSSIQNAEILRCCFVYSYRNSFTLCLAIPPHLEPNSRTSRSSKTFVATILFFGPSPNCTHCKRSKDRLFCAGFSQPAGTDERNK
jgi:hypothetical protein